MAHSKDSSQSGTFGLLFGSEGVDSNVEQVSDPKDGKDSKKRSSSKLAKKGKVSDAIDPQSERDLLDCGSDPIESSETTTERDEISLLESADGSCSNGENPSSGENAFSDAPEQLEETSSAQDACANTDSLSTQDYAARKVMSDEAPIRSPNLKSSAAYQVVARRYRPQTFDELIGQEAAARALSNAIETNRVGHAYLFTGARGVGKTSCARIFAKALNCVEGPTTKPCLKCDSCVAISTGEDVDVIEIDGASNRGVDEIRQLRQNAAIAPSRSRYKIYIIDEVHMLTREAFNALLKTLEEPPARVKFIFCTTEPNKIPITILSRCQRFDFNAIRGNSISSRLKQIAELEGAEVEEGVFDVLARRANGSMRDAQSLLEQLLSFAPKHVSLADAHSMLGSVDDEKIFELIGATVQGDSKRVFELLGATVALGVDFGTLVEQTFGAYRDLMIVGSGCEASELAYSPVARFNEIKQIAEKIGIRRILASLQILDQAIQRMRYSAQARIIAELAFARLCQLDAFQTIESLINQLKNGSIPQVPVDSVVHNPQQTSAENDKKKNKAALTAAKGEEETALQSQESSEVVSIQPLAENSQNDLSKSDVSPDLPKNDSPQTNVSWTSKSQEELAAIWREAADSDVELSRCASVFLEVKAEKPQTFVVVFPEGEEERQDFCERKRTTIESRLVAILGEPLVLRLTSNSSGCVSALNSKGGLEPQQSENELQKHSEVSAVDVPVMGLDKSAIPPVPSNYDELRREVSDSEVARQLQSIFGAELSDVKPTSQSTNRRPNQGGGYE